MNFVVVAGKSAAGLSATRIALMQRVAPLQIGPLYTIGVLELKYSLEKVDSKSSPQGSSNVSDPYTQTTNAMTPCHLKPRWEFPINRGQLA